MDLDSPEDDPPLLILVPPHPPSLKSIKIQELTNQVLLFQSQKFKLERAQATAEVEASLLKAQLAFPNVQQFTELLVNSLKPKLAK
ncbi:hypothetical protein Tco_0466849, partial [Tanacetum coccineum]